MPLYNKDSKLCEVIFHQPEVLTVVNRFGIYLGVGDASIDEVCHAHHLDTDFLLAILNTYLNEDYFPETVLKSFSLKKIISYLDKTDTYYRQFQLPNIEKHFNSLAAQSDPDNNIGLLRRFFLEMKQELLSRIDRDSKTLFPLLLKMEESGCAGQEDAIGTVIKLTGDEDHIEDKLNDLLSFFIIHLKGDYDANLCRAVVTSLSTLEKDVKQNNRIRERILRPLTVALIDNVRG